MKPTIDYQDFDKLDLRIGQVVKASVPDWSQKLIEMEVKFDKNIGQKTILAAIKNYYQPEDLINQHFIFLVNLKEKTLGQSTSQGMMLMAVTEDQQPILIKAQDSIKPGTVVR